MRVVGRSAHDGGGAFQPRHLEASQCLGHGIRVQAPGDDDRVFECHVRALRQEGQRGMRRVAQHAHAAAREMRQRIATEQSPFIRHVDVADDGLHVLVPAGEIAGTFVARPGFGPGFHQPVVAFHRTDEIQKFTAPQRIADDVAAMADPVGADKLPHVRRQAFHRHQTTPRHDAGEARAAPAEHLPADRRVHAIGREQDVAGDMVSVGQMQRDSVVCLIEAGAGHAGMHRIGRGRAHRGEQYAVEVAAMRHPIGRAVALHGADTEIEHRPGLPCCPQADFLAGGFADDPPHRRFEAQPDQHARAVGSQLHTGADFAQFRRLFEHAHVVAALQQCERRGQATQPGAGDQDAGFHSATHCLNCH